MKYKLRKTNRCRSPYEILKEARLEAKEKFLVAVLLMRFKHEFEALVGEEITELPFSLGDSILEDFGDEVIVTTMLPFSLGDSKVKMEDAVRDAMIGCRSPYEIHEKLKKVIGGGRR